MIVPHLAEQTRRVDTLQVSEIFHRTVQGEGPAAGRTASFLRLMGCNLSCSWCDSPFTWDATRFDLRQETSYYTAGQIADELDGQPGMLVISGGEPLLQQNRAAFRQLLAAMVTQKRPVHIETNGTVVPDYQVAALVETFVVSPKLEHAGAHRGHQDPTLQRGWANIPNAVLKVVCQDADDVADAAVLGRSIGYPPHRVWVMPEGTTTDVLAERWPVIATAAAQLGLSASHRLHVLAWGDERGR
jgi:organic radical activating enzyme